MPIQLIMILAALTGATSTGMPNYKELKSRVQAACQSEVDKLCSDVTRGEGRVASCLNSKQSELSSGCRLVWGTTKADVSRRIDKADVAFRKDCGSDVQKYCANVPSGRGRLLNCLDKHQDSLSASCQQFEAQLEQNLSQFMG